ncbi:hypothetical protein [Halopiger aswanensis]|uniref:Uncharacterized protein n=1 Tax=Halopiger aswanensis TaxID=148449 RepID=A0A3R7FUW2_9EURY|nr:hypothetical protein [Halopiger aswanensis]RKD93938.1 hypothetical protein ATJ93_3573 [Halopiger aswanensis]
MTDTGPTPDSSSSTADADTETHWSDHVRMLAYVTFLPAIVFLGPLVAIAVFALVWLLLPDPNAEEQ